MTNECDKLKPVELTVLMPVRNEGINLRIMLKMLRAMVEVPCEVLVVHDTAEDDSLEVVQAMQESYPYLRSIHNRMGPGVINAIRSGVAAAQGQRILLFAADEVGSVLAIEDMLSLMDQRCDFISCTRYANGGRRLGGSMIGGFLSRRANRLFRLLTGTRFTDCTTGIKIFRRDIFEKLNLQARPIGWALAFEMAIKAQYVGLQLGEVSIISIDWLYGGKSTFTLGPWCKEYFRWFVWGMRHLRKSRQAMPNVKLVEPQMSCR